MKSVASRFVLGLLKGAVVGGGVGYGLIRLGLLGDSFLGGILPYLACGVVGAVVGLVAGRAPWRAETIWTPVIKMVVGGLIGAGMAALGIHFLPSMTFNIQHVGAVGLASAPVLSVAVGLLYGLFVEIDDGGDDKPPESKKLPAR
jgi:hypothetical protein